MSRELYLGSQSTKHGYWTSFEDDPHLATVKSTVRYKCTPCIEGLYNQLIQGKQEIRMDNAMGCWKVVAVLNNEEECIHVLNAYQEMFLPDRHLRGRFGSQQKDGTKAIVINADTEQERDTLLLELGQCASDINQNCQLFYSRGCAYLYERILGDWRQWQPITIIKHPENVAEVIQRIRDLLEIP